MGKRIFSFAVALITVICTSLSAFAFEPTDFKVSAKAGILMIYDTGEVLFEQEADTEVNVAALNMLMTALVIKEHCTDIKAYDAVMTKQVQKRLWGTGLSVAELLIDGRYSIDELLHLALMYSYSDALVLAAVTVFGSEGECITAMNAKAAELGMSNTVFTDIIGDDATGYSTARDMSILFRKVLADNDLRDILSTRKYELHNNEYRKKATTRYDMLTVSSSCMNINPTTVHYYGKAIAGKTGTTTVAGRCIANLCQTKSAEYVCILLGEPNTKEKDSKGNTVRYDFRDVKSLVEWAISTFSYRQIVSVGSIVSDMPLKHSADADRIALASADDLYATLPKDADGSTLIFDCHLSSDTAYAPIEAGTEMGKADVMYAGVKIGEITLVTVTGAESSFILVIKDAFASVLASKWFKIVVAVIVAAIVLLIIVTVFLNVGKKVKRSKKVHKDDYR